MQQPQKLFCVNCGSYLGRHQLPTGGFFDVYCASKTCKCHLRTESVNGQIIFRLLEQQNQPTHHAMMPAA